MSLRDELTRRFPALADVGPGCFVVGGAVRDLLYGREPADVDVACPDPLAAANRVGGRVVRLGDQAHLSAWRVVLPEHVYDFAAIEGADIVTDLARRDFTINAMAVDLDGGALLDPHGGREDLGRAVVRMVDASNFDDDPLRVLKGVRMAVVLDFEIEPRTLEAMRQRAGRIQGIAAERVLYELTVILGAGRLRKAVALLREAGLEEPLGLEGRPLAADEVSPAGALALLVGDPRAHARRWRWSAALLHDVTTLRGLAGHHRRVELFDAGESVSRQLPGVLRALGVPADLDWPDFTTRALLSGEEIAGLAAVEPGPRLGALKRALLEAQVRGEVRSREEAERFVRALAAQR